MSAATHIVWDWNGTLLDDTGAALGALNAMLARRGIAAVSMESYRARFRFPARQYYEEIGMPVPDAEWDAIAQEYHDSYDVESASAALNVEAVAALELARSRGARQSILSALRQDLLEEAVERFGVSGYFDFVRVRARAQGGDRVLLVAAAADRDDRRRHPRLRGRHRARRRMRPLRAGQPQLRAPRRAWRAHRPLARRRG